MTDYMKTHPKPPMLCPHCSREMTERTDVWECNDCMIEVWKNAFDPETPKIV